VVYYLKLQIYSLITTHLSFCETTALVIANYVVKRELLPVNVHLMMKQENPKRVVFNEHMAQCVWRRQANLRDILLI